MYDNHDEPWLPPLILFETYGGDWKRYEAAIYDRFRSDFVLSRPTFHGRRLGLKRHPEYDGKSATYWHFISEGRVEADRTPDMRRCERIGWPRAIIEAAVDPLRVHVWKTERPNAEPRWSLSLHDYSYLVVLADRGEYLLPWTAFHIERDHQRAKRAREHQAYVQRVADARRRKS